VNYALATGLLLVAGGVSGILVPRVLGPAGTTRFMTGIIVVTGIATACGALMTATIALPKLHDLVDRVGWCPSPHPVGHAVPVEVATIAAVFLAVSVFRGYRYLRSMYRHHATFAGINGIKIIVTDEPIAIAIPGRPGGVVIGSKLMRALNCEEQSALLAHEQAHLRLNHHRYVHLTGLIAAMFPLLVPLARQVRYMTERWADETAAKQVGSRTLVARTIAKVALMSPTAPRTLALTFIGFNTSSRVNALLESPSTNRRLAIAAVVVSAVLATLVGTSVGLGHITQAVFFLCHA